MLKTNITEMFGIKYPIFSAPMGPFHTEQLAAVVSEAGGLGVLAHVGLIGENPVSVMMENMKYVVERTDKPFGFNIRTGRIEKYWYDKLVTEIPEFIMENPKIKEQCIYAVTSAGSSRILPQSKTFQKLKKVSEIKHFHVAPAFWLAEKCVRYGVDGLCVTGYEGGGHQSYEGVGGFVLLDQVQQAFPDIPKVAAGGIATGAQLAAALTMGYGGVVMGTRFIASEECEFPQDYKQLTIDAQAKDTVILRGQLANIRLYNNEYAKSHHVIVSKDEKIAYEQSLSQEQAKENALAYDRLYEGDIVNTAIPMGQSAGLTHDIKEVSSIIETVIKDAENSIKNATKLFR